MGGRSAKFNVDWYMNQSLTLMVNALIRTYQSTRCRRKAVAFRRFEKVVQWRMRRKRWMAVMLVLWRVGTQVSAADKLIDSRS